MNQDHKPSIDFSSRLDSAKRFRQDAEEDIKAALAFCAPDRADDFTRKGRHQKPAVAETYSSVAESLAMDLASDLVTYFTPAEAPWSEYEVIVDVPEDEVDAVQQLVEDREQTFRDLIESSNYYDIAFQWGLEAAMHGTAALWASASHLMQPIHFEVVQPHELYITPGHLGILDRFREKTVLCQHLPALFQGYDVNLTAPQIAQKMAKPGTTCTVMWGFWVDWADPGFPQWKCEITVDGKRVTPKDPIPLGHLAGTCPLLVGRFNPRAGRPWARGPGITATRDLLVHDKVRETTLSAMEQALTSTLVYADDGFLDFSEGIQRGRAYPAHRGFTRESVYELPRDAKLEQAYFSEDRLLAELARHFFQDGPRQRGDTPPTATQWIDERRRVQQRIGKPASPIWSELVLQTIQRVEYLGVQLGKMPTAITLNGQAIVVRPLSPLQTAQNQDAVMIARSNLDLAFQLAQDSVGQVVDLPSTFREVIRKSGDKITKLAPPQQAQNAPPVS